MSFFLTQPAFFLVFTDYLFADDDFLLFADQTVPCSLCQDLHYGLSCVAFIVGAVVFLEHILAQVRGTDLSPSLLIRHTYSVFVTSAVLLYIYLLAVPEASVQNPTDAPVLLTVLAVRIISVMSLAVQTNIQTIVTCRDILRKNRLRGHLAVDVVIRVIFVPIVIIANVSIAVTLVIVPTAFVGSSSDDSTLMSTFEQVHAQPDPDAGYKYLKKKFFFFLFRLPGFARASWFVPKTSSCATSPAWSDASSGTTLGGGRRKAATSSAASRTQTGPTGPTGAPAAVAFARSDWPCSKN